MSRRISFRGLLADNGQERISLTTRNGKTGYKIVKFELMGNTPGAALSDMEAVTKIYKTLQSTVTAEINFSDNRLLAAGIYTQNSSSFNYPSSLQVVFDNEIFNQDIYITCSDVSGNSKACNYYLELEVFDLALDEATVATLKDIRNSD